MLTIYEESAAPNDDPDTYDEWRRILRYGYSAVRPEPVLEESSLSNERCDTSPDTSSDATTAILRYDVVRPELVLGARPSPQFYPEPRFIQASTYANQTYEQIIQYYYQVKGCDNVQPKLVITDDTTLNNRPLEVLNAPAVKGMPSIRFCSSHYWPYRYIPDIRGEMRVSDTYESVSHFIAPNGITAHSFERSLTALSQKCNDQGYILIVTLYPDRFFQLLADNYSHTLPYAWPLQINQSSNTLYVGSAVLWEHVKADSSSDDDTLPDHMYEELVPRKTGCLFVVIDLLLKFMDQFRVSRLSE